MGSKYRSWFGALFALRRYCKTGKISKIGRQKRVDIITW